MNEKNYRVYLDNCCYNRPYDNQADPRVHLEANAKMLIQDMIRLREIDLVTSSVLYFEISKSPFGDRKEAITAFVDEYGKDEVIIDEKPDIKEEAHEIMKTGIKLYDAYHFACAIYAGCEYFLSTDKRLLKYSTDKIKIINPIDFIKEMENNHD